MKRNLQSGFSVIEVLLISVVVGIIGFTGWYVLHAAQNSDDSYAASGNSSTPDYTTKTVQPTEPTTTDTRESWVNCADSQRSLTFKYPADWRTESILNPCRAYTEKQVASDGADLLLQIFSPKDSGRLFRIWYRPIDKPVPSDDLSDTMIVVRVEDFVTDAGNKLYLVGFGDEYNDDKKALTAFAVSDKKYAIGDEFKGYPTVKSSNGKLFVLNAWLTKNDGGDSESYRYSTYQAQPGYDDLISIFKSLKY